jgi:hypothetical protein
MKEILNEEWLCHMLDAVINSRVKQLETKLVQWDEFSELANIRQDILNSLKEQIPRNVKHMLNQYDDASGMMVAKASDYFYERGFADCLYLLGEAVEKKLLE